MICLGILPYGYYPAGCGGHIDAFCRFVNDSTIMLAETTMEESKTDSIALENYQRMEENYAILKNATDQKWKTLQHHSCAHSGTKHL